MFELVIRAKELASSNLGRLIDGASNPAIMLKLLLAELEETVIVLERDAASLDRSTHRFTQDAEQFDAAAQTWEDKAKLALSRNREDLARGALAERNTATDAATKQRAAAAVARNQAGDLRTQVAHLEAKHGETRARLLKVMSEASPARIAANVASKTSRRTEAMLDRFAALENRIDYAASDRALPATLDQELAALANDATLAAALAALRKSAGKKK